jgi:malic enzyme
LARRVFFFFFAACRNQKENKRKSQKNKKLETFFQNSLGDLGIGGLGISAGKIQLYVGGAGFHPEHAMPVILDAGTNRQSLLEDPSYLGVREPRLGDEDHMKAVVEFCDAVKERFPDALVQFEDFQTDRAFAILEKCRDRLASC